MDNQTESNYVIKNKIKIIKKVNNISKFWLKKFLLKDRIFDKNRNFGQRSKVWLNIEILVKKSNFWSKIKILVNDRNFDQRSKFYSKIEFS